MKQHRSQSSQMNKSWSCAKMTMGQGGGELYGFTLCPIFAIIHQCGFGGVGGRAGCRDSVEEMESKRKVQE